MCERVPTSSRRVRPFVTGPLLPDRNPMTPPTMFDRFPHKTVRNHIPSNLASNSHNKSKKPSGKKKKPGHCEVR